MAASNRNPDSQQLQLAVWRRAGGGLLLAVAGASPAALRSLCSPCVVTGCHPPNPQPPSRQETRCCCGCPLDLQSRGLGTTCPTWRLLDLPELGHVAIPGCERLGGKRNSSCSCLFVVAGREIGNEWEGFWFNQSTVLATL